MKITRSTPCAGLHETEMLTEWYAAIGSFRVRVAGVGETQDEADTNARLLLGQARAQLIQETGEADKLGVLADFMGANV